MISKENFIKIITSIQEDTIKRDKLETTLNETYLDGYSIITNPLVDIMIDIFTDEFDNERWLEWWLYDAPANDKTITEIDGTIRDLSNIEDLYNYMIEIYKEND